MGSRQTREPSPVPPPQGGNAMSTFLHRRWRTLAVASTAVLAASILSAAPPASAAQTIGLPTFTGPAIPQPPVGYNTGSMMQSIYDSESGGTDFWMDRLLARPG